MNNQLDLLKGHDVELDFHGMIYKGTLADSSDIEIFLQTEASVMVFPMDEVSDIRLPYGQ